LKTENYDYFGHNTSKYARFENAVKIFDTSVIPNKAGNDILSPFAFYVRWRILDNFIFN
jgi:hypothetical protein